MVKIGGLENREFSSNQGALTLSKIFPDDTKHTLLAISNPDVPSLFIYFAKTGTIVATGPTWANSIDIDGRETRKQFRKGLNRWRTLKNCSQLMVKSTISSTINVV